MPYDSAGNYSLPTVYKAIPATSIQTQQHNTPLEDIQAALNRVLLRDGSAPLTANINMNGFGFTGLTTLTVPAVTDWTTLQAVGAKDADARYVRQNSDINMNGYSIYCTLSGSNIRFDKNGHIEFVDNANRIAAYYSMSDGNPASYNVSVASRFNATMTTQDIIVNGYSLYCAQGSSSLHMNNNGHIEFLDNQRQVAAWISMSDGNTPGFNFNVKASFNQDIFLNGYSIYASQGNSRLSLETGGHITFWDNSGSLVAGYYMSDGNAPHYDVNVRTNFKADVWIGGSVRTQGNAGFGSAVSIGNGQNDWSGDAGGGYNPIYSWKQGWAYLGGGVYHYAPSGTALYIGSGAVGASIISFYTQGAGGNSIGGIINNGSSVQYASTSDYRLKTDIATLDPDKALSVVSVLRPVAYDWKKGGAGRQTGFIAHELQAAIPGAVTGEKDAVDTEGNIRPQLVETKEIIPYLVAALQNALARIEELERKATLPLNEAAS